MKAKGTTESASVVAVLNLVCRALKQVGYTWSFAVSSHDHSQIDSRTMIINSPNGTELLLFYHRLVPSEDMQAVSGLDYFAMDFGVKKHS